jgi:hypothetical protein
MKKPIYQEKNEIGIAINNALSHSLPPTQNDE